MVKDRTPVIGARWAYTRDTAPLNAKLKKPLRYHGLHEEGHGLWMTDLPEELNQIEEMLYDVRPQGHVLVGGLGLGIVAKRVAEIIGVKSVTVVEKSRNIIKLCANRSYNTVCSDIIKYLRTASFPFDYFLLDTWCGTNETTWWNEVLPLRRLIRQRWGAKPVLHCWAEDIMFGQVKRQLMMCPQPHWHYVKEILGMKEKQADAFLNEAGLPEWEKVYGKAIDATTKRK